MYNSITTSFATLNEQIKFVHREVFGAKFSLKGFEYPWIIDSREWKKGERVMDVGAGYSSLPMHLADTYRCDVWAVDDFGLSSGEPFWKRHLEPEEHIRNNPQVTFIRERLGDREHSSLPEGTFDCIFSASALEHVPNEFVGSVWQHMDALLKPGGELIHGIDMQFPVNRGAASILKAFLLDLVFPILPERYQIKFVYFTPLCYLRYISRKIGARFDRKEINTFKMITDPSIILDSPNFFYNRFKENAEQELRIRRNTAMLVHIRKPA